MGNVYISPHSICRNDDTSGIMYTIAQTIASNFEDNDTVNIYVPEDDSGDNDKSHTKYKHIRDAKKLGVNLFISLQETNDLSQEPYIGIYCSSINIQSSLFAHHLDLLMYNILPYIDKHVIENSNDISINKFEYECPSIVFYINHNMNNDTVIQELSNNIEKITAAFVDAIGNYFDDGITEKVTKYKSGHKFIINSGICNIKVWSRLDEAMSCIDNDYYLGDGEYYIHAYCNGYYNISTDENIPGVWIVDTELEDILQ